MDSEKKITFIHVISLIIVILLPTLFIYQNKIDAQYPCCTIASDGWYTISYVEGMLDGTEPHQQPKFLHFSDKQLYTNQPPLLHIVSSIFTKILDLRSFSAVYILSMFNLIFLIIIMFLFIRRYDKNLAYLSIPIFGFFAVKPFNSIFYHGQFYDIIGTLFLISFLFLIYYIRTTEYADKSKIFTLFLITLSALIITHLEFIYLFIIASSFLFIDYLYNNKKISLKYLIIFIVSSIVAVLINLDAFYRIIILFPGSSFFLLSELPQLFGQDTPSLFIFGIFVPLIVIGLISFIYKLFKTKFDFFVYSIILLFLLSFSSYIGFARYAEIRLFWPVLLAPLVGSPLKFLISLIKNGENRIFFTKYCSLFIIILILIPLTLVSYPKYGPETEKNLWDGIFWIREKTPQNSSVLFLITDTQIWTRIFWYSKRPSYTKGIQDILNNNQSLINNSYEYLFIQGYEKEGFLKYKLSQIFAEKPLCHMNYVFFKTDYNVYDFFRIYKSDYVYNEILNNTNFKLEFNNSRIYIFSQNETCR